MNENKPYNEDITYMPIRAGIARYPSVTIDSNIVVTAYTNTITRHTNIATYLRHLHEGEYYLQLFRRTSYDNADLVSEELSKLSITMSFMHDVYIGKLFTKVDPESFYTSSDGMRHYLFVKDPDQRSESERLLP